MVDPHRVLLIHLLPHQLHLWAAKGNILVRAALTARYSHGWEYRTQLTHVGRSALHRFSSAWTRMTGLTSFRRRQNVHALLSVSLVSRSRRVKCKRHTFHASESLRLQEVPCKSRTDWMMLIDSSWAKWWTVVEEEMDRRLVISRGV